jgi:hypothetical protein
MLPSEVLSSAFLPALFILISLQNGGLAHNPSRLAREHGPSASSPPEIQMRAVVIPVLIHGPSILLIRDKTENCQDLWALAPLFVCIRAAFLICSPSIGNPR